MNNKLSDLSVSMNFITQSMDKFEEHSKAGVERLQTTTKAHWYRATSRNFIFSENPPLPLVASGG